MSVPTRLIIAVPLSIVNDFRENLSEMRMTTANHLPARDCRLNAGPIHFLFIGCRTVPHGSK